MMSSNLALPRKGHLAQVLHIFTYLKKHHNYALLFDPSYPDVNIDTFLKHDWTKFYGDFKEGMPPDIPEPLRKEVGMLCFVYSDHNGEKLTRRYCSCFIFSCRWHQYITVRSVRIQLRPLLSDQSLWL